MGLGDGERGRRWVGCEGVLGVAGRLTVLARSAGAGGDRPDIVDRDRFPLGRMVAVMVNVTVPPLGATVIGTPSAIL